MIPKLHVALFFPLILSEQPSVKGQSFRATVGSVGTGDAGVSPGAFLCRHHGSRGKQTSGSFFFLLNGTGGALGKSSMVLSFLLPAW